ncbi:MAG: Ig-like domain-containing protein, partial [Candidatus Shapirobacteria bacterium]|nr:Ig-like domain-containing protein [Candidatus Shapirobacteria bacterium]
ITNPSDNETVSTKKPEFFGDGPAGEKLTIKVESPIVYTDEITINEDGTWNWSPPENLTPGEHTITITGSNNTILSHKFVVLAAEDEPSFSASGSAEIETPTPSPTEIPTPTPTSIPTPTLNPTSTPTIFINEASPTIVQTTPSELPQTGNIAPTFLLFFISLTSVAFAVFFLQKE